MPASTRIIRGWPGPSREAARLVIDKYGEPDEATDSQLIWHHPGPWKRIDERLDGVVVRRREVVVVVGLGGDDYRVPSDMAPAVAQFDGSVIVERSAGEASARCHDEEANFLALNLMHDIVEGTKTVQEARDYYAREFADYRRKLPTPYMEGLRFKPADGGAADLDRRALSDEDLEKAVEEGKQRSG